jgi:hypothetical protein
VRDHDHRKYAEECLRRAEFTASWAARLMFLDMAQHWLNIAERAEMIGTLEAAPQHRSHQHAA